MGIDLSNLLDECNVIEYKETDCEGLYKSVCALANTDGGCIIIGIENATKKPVGFDLNGGKQEAIINKITHTIGIQPNIKLYNIDGKDVLKIIVEKSSNPVQYKGKYYKRVGNTTKEATSEELRKLLLKNVSWDSIKNNCYIDDINRETVRKFVKLAVNEGRLADEVVSYDVKEVLEHLGLILDGKLTNGAILLFGKEPQKIFNKVNIRIGLFKGINEEIIIGDKTVSGNIFNQIQEAETVLKSYINVKYNINSMVRKEVWEYPLTAIREALLNSIIHKDYHDYSSEIQIKIFGDYIWFYNPGTLFGGLTIEELKTSHPSKARNPLIMDVVFRAGYVESFGTGIKRMTRACLKQGMPAPIISENSSGFVIQINKEYDNINERQKKALEYVVVHEYITNSIFQEINDCSRDISKRDLKKLVELGILKSIGENKFIKYIFKI